MKITKERFLNFKEKAFINHFPFLDIEEIDAPSKQDIKANNILFNIIVKPKFQDMQVIIDYCHRHKLFILFYEWPDQCYLKLALTNKSIDIDTYNKHISSLIGYSYDLRQKDYFKWLKQSEI